MGMHFNVRHPLSETGKGRETHRLFVVWGPEGRHAVYQFKSLVAAWRRLKSIQSIDDVHAWSITSL